MLEKKVSIIIPLYNVEKYISVCINSVLHQTYSNFEVIVVNDGSTDSSADIVKHFEETDSRISLINQKNSGVSSARNNGLDKASGEYVVFVDADDFLAPDFLEYMLYLCQQSGADFCLSENAFTQVDEAQVVQDNIRVLNSEEAVALLMSPRIIVGCWNKIYRREFLKKNDIKFSSSLFYGEGLNFITRVADKANSTCVGTRKVYYYRRNNEMSATTTFNINKMRNGEAALDITRHEIQNNSQKIDDMFCLHKGLFSLGAVTKIINNNVKKDYINDYLRWKRILNNSAIKLTFSKNVSMYRKTMLWGGVLCPAFLARLDAIRRSRITKKSFFN